MIQKIMRSNPQHIQAMDAVTPVVVTSSTDASPSVVTTTAHGLSTGDLVMIYGHTTNISVNGINEVIKINDNTFSLINPYTRVAVDGSGAGAGADGLLYAKPKIILAENFNVHVFEMMTSGTATLTVKFATSEGLVYTDSNNGEILPNIGGTVDIDNPWKFVDFIERDGGGAIIPGDTGLAWAGADAAKSIELNIAGAKYIAIVVTAWTQGALSTKVGLYDNR